MIKLGGLVDLNALHEAEVFTATNKETGNVSVFKSKEKRDAAVKSGSHEMKKDDKEDSVDVKGLDDKPKVNIFNKDEEEPKSEPSQPKRQGNPEVNKKSLELSKEMGMTPQDFGNKKEYQDAMIGAAVSALTDANFHSEARELVAKVLGRPELAQKPDYPKLRDADFDEKMAKIKDFYSAGDKYTKPSDESEEYGIKIAQEAGWSGDDALNGIAFTLRQNGFKKLADTMQSVIKENKSTRLKDLK
jgi:hypothetical protein